MSSIDPLTPGSELLHFRLAERLSATVWRAEDTRSGKAVAVKVLTRQLPREAARREQVIREVRLGAALYHVFLVPVLDILPAGDCLLLVMELLDVQPLSAFIDGKPRQRSEVLRIGYQTADVLKFLQARNMVHGNINSESVMISPNGMVHLGGLNLLNLLSRKEGSSSAAFQQKGNDAKSVAFMAPEQIAGQAVDARTDVFSMGVLLYELATGALPWNGTTAGDLARAVVEGQPQSPLARNPQIAGDVMNVIGRCLFKDPYRRHKDVRAVVDDISRADPDVIAYAADLAKKATAPAQTSEAHDTRPAILLLADVVDFDRMNQVHPETALNAAARMQQIVGESVYLFDGQVVDPFGPQFIGELPSVEAALEAARKTEFDFSLDQQGDNPIHIHLLLHAGDVSTKDGSVVGDAITKGFAALSQIPPLQLLLTEAFVRKGRGSLRLRDAGARGGLKLYEIVPPEPQPEPEPAAATVAANEEEAAVPPMVPRRSRAAVWVALGFLLLMAGVGGILLTRRDGKNQPVKSVAVAPVVQYPRNIVIETFSAEGADPAMLERAAAIRAAALEILRNVPELHILDASAADSVTLGAKIRTGAAGPEIVTTLSGTHAATGPAAAAPDVASGVQAVVQWMAAQAHVSVKPAAAPALNAFADALTARQNKDDAKTEASIRAAVAADPNFLPAQLMAMSFFESKGNAAEALTAGKQVFALAPERVDVARKVAQGSLSSGDAVTALSAYRAILKNSAGDAEALNTIGRYALAVADNGRFTSAVVRLKSAPATERMIHDPDMLVATGKIESAIDQYYNIEVDVPNNPALSLKIGRIAVLRHTIPIAELELGKLQKSDPNYGYPLLKAYMAAQRNSKAEAETALNTAMSGSRGGDDYWTSAAEVYAMLGDNAAVIAALQKAADRREPTMSYILNDPLFTYLSSDPAFQAVRTTLAERQQEIRTALAQAPL